MEHREQPINILLHIVGGFHDVRFEQGIHHRVLSCFMVNVMDFGSENLVFAVFTPRLRQALQFHVRRGIG